LPIVLTIAGSDSGGGAGIQADLKTFEAHGCFGISALAALTAQNTQGVTAIHVPPVDFLQAQLEALFQDFAISAVKMGMLGSADVVRTVAIALRNYLAGKAIPVVLDPVMVSTSGHRLLQADAHAALVDELFPLATALTPNLPEAEALLGHPLPAHTSDAAMLPALHNLRALAPQAAVLLKGGHNPQPDTRQVCDYLLMPDGQLHTYAAPHLTLPQPAHGTGCTLSSAIAANLAHGFALPEAVRRAKAYVWHALRLSPPDVGHGNRPLRHALAGFGPTHPVPDPPALAETL